MRRGDPLPTGTIPSSFALAGLEKFRLSPRARFLSTRARAN
ncbi:hypothetical protein NY78_3672 [Desulfovibrio sp. TomC]|nr:hypothetical protein NY78_3672 [Desulfovibrio sp. TomC]